MEHLIVINGAFNSNNSINILEYNYDIGTSNKM